MNELKGEPTARERTGILISECLAVTGAEATLSARDVVDAEKAKEEVHKWLCPTYVGPIYVSLELPGKDGKPVSLQASEKACSKLRTKMVMEEVAAATIKVAALKEILRALASPDINEIYESMDKDVIDA
eukprot:scaffold93983_cov66-Attheya_sp.AAC.2